MKQYHVFLTYSKDLSWDTTNSDKRFVKVMMFKALFMPQDTISLSDATVLNLR